ncbi:MAG: hypothetical protein ACTTKL_01080 [Treponema sp.]
MTYSKIRAALCASVFFCAFAPLLHAEAIVDPEYGYSLDIPEGYAVSGHTEDGKSYLFTHSGLPVQLVLRLYPDSTYANPDSALTGSIQKLGSKNETVPFTWGGIPSSIANFEMDLNGIPYKGWGVAAALPEKNAHLVLLCYADREKYEGCNQFIVSTVNSLAVGRGGLDTPGIITAYAYPKEGEKDLALEIGGKRVNVKVDTIDSEAAQFVVDCEYDVLKLYAGHPKWKEAWERYYRMIFRDSYGRLNGAAQSIRSSLSGSGKKQKTLSEAALNGILLDWVQNFEYKRSALNDSDFTNLIDCISGKGSDCDSRSLLLCVLLTHYGVKSALFVSQQYAHAVYGADIKAEGAKISAGGTDFLLGETTAKGIKPGRIAEDMSDTAKWIPVLLP